MGSSADGRDGPDSDERQRENDPDYEPAIFYDNFWIRNPQSGYLLSDGNFMPAAKIQASIATEQTSSASASLPDELSEIKVQMELNKPTDTVLKGEILLFSTFRSEIIIYRNVSIAQPWAEVVRPTKQQIRISSFLPSLRGSVLDCIALQDLKFCYTPISFDESVPAGMYLHTDVSLNGILQPVSDVLRDFFHQEHQAIHFSAHLGTYRDWDDPLELQSLICRASLDATNVNVLGIMDITQIGIEIILDGNHNYITNKSEWDFGYGFFGTTNFKVYGTTVPLICNYHFRKYSSHIHLSVILTDDEWKNVLGVQGLSLRNVVLRADLAGFTQFKGARFSVSANLLWNSTLITVAGTYSSNDYYLEAYIGDLKLADLVAAFEQFMGHQIEFPDYDIVFEKIYLKVGNRGISFVGAVKFDGHTSAQATITIDKEGIGLTGAIQNITFESLEVRSAALDIFIASSKESGMSSRFAIAGDVHFSGVDLKVSLLLMKDKISQRTQWAIYGEASGDLTISRFCPKVKGSDFDISLSHLALIAASSDVSLGSYNPKSYPVAKGIQFCATIDSIKALEDLLGADSVKGTVLQAGYINGAFNLKLIMPAKRTIRFSDAVYTGPFAFSIEAKTNVQIGLHAILNIKLQSQLQPLSFTLALKAGPLGAKGSAQMITDWINPFGIGKDVVIKKGAVELGITYATLLAQGPDSFALAGELYIGKKMAAMAVKLSTNPSEIILVAKVEDLGVVDVVAFASLIAEKEFPKPDNFLHFTKLDLYLSGGGSIGELYFERGVHMRGDVLIFGKRAKFSCSFGKLLKVFATIEAFKIGPFSISGATGPDPVVDIELSSARQYVLIDGAVRVWGALAAVHLEANLHPTPTFDFWVTLELSDLFIVKLRANLEGKIDIKDIKSLDGVDFKIYALLEQRIIEYVSQQVILQLNAAQEIAKQGFDEAKRKFDAMEAQWKKNIEEAQAKVEDARRAYQKKVEQLQASLDEIIKKAEETRKRLTAAIDGAKQNLDAAINNAVNTLENVKNAAALAIRTANEAIDTANQIWDSTIGDANGKLEIARDAFNSAFGNARNDIEEKQRIVEQGEQGLRYLDQEIERIQRDYDNTSGWTNPGRVLDLTYELNKHKALRHSAWLGIEGAKQGLQAAREVLSSYQYVTMEAGFKNAANYVQTVKDEKTKVLRGLRYTLEEVTRVQNGLITEAQNHLNYVRTASQESELWNQAKNQLVEAERALTADINRAKDNLKDVAKSIEFATFDEMQEKLQWVKENVKDLNIARHAMSAAESVVNIGLDFMKDVAAGAMKSINVRKIEFNGSLKGLIDDGPPIRVKIEGSLFAEAFNIEIVWKPRFNLVKFVKALFDELWEKVKSKAKGVKASAMVSSQGDVVSSQRTIEFAQPLAIEHNANVGGEVLGVLRGSEVPDLIDDSYFEKDEPDDIRVSDAEDATVDDKYSSDDDDGSENEVEDDDDNDENNNINDDDDDDDSDNIGEHNDSDRFKADNDNNMYEKDEDDNEEHNDYDAKTDDESSENEESSTGEEQDPNAIISEDTLEHLQDEIVTDPTKVGMNDSDATDDEDEADQNDQDDQEVHEDQDDQEDEGKVERSHSEDDTEAVPDEREEQDESEDENASKHVNMDIEEDQQEDEASGSNDGEQDSDQEEEIHDDEDSGEADGKVDDTAEQQKRTHDIDTDSDASE